MIGKAVFEQHFVKALLSSVWGSFTTEQTYSMNTTFAHWNIHALAKKYVVPNIIMGTN